jgi:hypothetical protein
MLLFFIDNKICKGFDECVAYWRFGSESLFWGAPAVRICNGTFQTHVRFQVAWHVNYPPATLIYGFRLDRIWLWKWSSLMEAIPHNSFMNCVIFINLEIKQKLFSHEIYSIHNSSSEILHITFTANIINSLIIYLPYLNFRMVRGHAIA